MSMLLLIIAACLLSGGVQASEESLQVEAGDTCRAPLVDTRPTITFTINGDGDEFAYLLIPGIHAINCTD